VSSEQWVLPTRRQRHAFILTSRLLDGFSLGIVITMFWLLVSLSLPDFDSVWSTAVTATFPIAPTSLSLLLFVLIFLGLGLVLLGGLRGNRLPTTSAPNQGIWLSASSGLAAAGLFAIVMSLATAFFWGGVFGALVGILTGWIAAALYGMGSVLNHLWLRFWLVQLGQMPWAYTDFLDEAANRAILHKVGGGYIFIHRLLQEYFASHH
jgi:hypothetical protein